ncbi:efflux RND transporter permease subunit [Deinococcus misasensis]|uniref:efflux RND transporter permease subunit n=1 Tax=Deinococcus misasensis TaxID=392413 RepID=UPI000557A18A|nr:efflux RND transporter permease subunit [Deinococcus misasensis]
MRESPIVKFFVNRFVFATAIFGALILIGILSFRGIGVDVLPKFEVPVVAVVTTYPGAGPEEVANQISKPIEDALATLPGIDSLSSVSNENVSQVIVQFDYGKDVDQAAVEVSQRVNSARASLPSDANAPVVQKFDPTGTPILSVALSAPGKDLLEVADYAEDILKLKIQRVDGVTGVAVTGAPEREVQVLLDPAKLANYRITPSQISQAISANSLNLAAGSSNIQGERITYSLRNTAKTPEDVAQIIVDTSRGLRVQDVAVVRDSSAELETYSRVNGEPVITLSVQKSSDANSVAVAADIRKELAALKLPEGYKTTVVSDTTEAIKLQVDDTWKDAYLTIIVVSIVCLVFLGKLNTVFSVVLAIPISILGAIIMFPILGFTFNIISLLAIIVAIGIVVDDSIVVAENVERYRRLGFNLKDSVLKGASEVTSAVSASTLSLMAVFIPISFLPGIVGQFFQQFGVVLAAAVAVSWAEALFFLTVRMAYFPDPKELTFKEALAHTIGPKNLIHGLKTWWKVPFSWVLLLGYGVALFQMGGAIYLIGLLAYPLVYALLVYLFNIFFELFNASATNLHELNNRGFNGLQNVYASTLAAGLKRPAVVIVLAVLALGSVGIVGPKIPFNFTPKTDNSIIIVNLKQPKGINLESTNENVRLLENYFLQKPEVKVVETQVGVNGPERARLTVEMVKKKERSSDVYALAEAYRKDVAELYKNNPQVDVKLQIPQGGPQGESDIAYFLKAPTPELLEERTAKMLEVLRSKDYTTDVRSDLSETTPEQVFVPDREKLVGTGITPFDIANTLRTYNSGASAGVVRRSGEEYDIVLKADPTVIGTESALLSLPIYAPALQQTIPLSSLGKFESSRAPARLSRQDQQFGTTVYANLRPGAPGLFQVQGELQNEFKDKKIIDDQVTLEEDGSSAFVGDLASAAPFAFGLALILNFLVIASQFNSFRYPFYILLPIPLALVGAFWFSYWFGTGLDVVSVLGTVLLIGLVTKNAILLLDFVVREAQSQDLREALVEAAKLRLRPILMTTITVLVISLPLILGIGEGGELRKPLGVIVLGGVLTGTILTLYVVPAVFYLFERKRFERGERLVAE